MSPALMPGSVVLVNRLAYLFGVPKVNDIVVFKSPVDHKILIKRIAKVENGEYFLLGDNMKLSTDSRKFGMIDRKDIIGKVIYKL